MQSPFVTLFLNLDETDEYAEEVALIIEEILKQRIQGIKNEKGIYTTPTFPKLVYVLHEHNCLEGGKYDYITELAVECSSKRLYPDYISAKEMRKIYEGNYDNGASNNQTNGQLRVESGSVQDQPIDIYKEVFGYDGPPDKFEEWFNKHPYGG